MARMNIRGTHKLASARKIVTSPSGHYREVLALRSDGTVLLRIDTAQYSATGYRCGHWSVAETTTARLKADGGGVRVFTQHCERDGYTVDR